MLYSNEGGVLLKIVESLLFVRAGAGVGGAAGEKNPPASQHCTCTMYRYCALCNVQCAMCNVQCAYLWPGRWLASWSAAEPLSYRTDGRQPGIAGLAKEIIFITQNISYK